MPQGSNDHSEDIEMDMEENNMNQQQQDEKYLQEELKRHYVRLQKSLAELVDDYIDRTGKSPDTTTIRELMDWVWRKIT